MKVANDVLLVLDRCTTDGSVLLLPPGQLDRKLYVAVNKVLEAAGGKWDRQAKGHIFSSDAADAIDQIMQTGEVATSREDGWFPTPAPIVDTMIKLAGLEPWMTVLEPSAGEGAILTRVAPLVAAVSCVEVNPERAAKLEASGLAFQVGVRDFLEMTPVAAFDRVLMNPPFAKQADIAHVEHALRYLHPGGLLVSVMTLGVTFRENRKARDFRDLAEERQGRFITLPADAFREVGTGVKTVLAVIPGASS